MKIEFYVAAGWLLAVVMTVYGIFFGRRDRKSLPLFVIAGIVMAVGAGWRGGEGGLCVLGGDHSLAALTYFCIMAVGLAIWSIAYVFTKDDA